MAGARIQLPIRISFGFSIADNVALGVLYGPWVVPMKSWFVQLSIGVSYVSMGGVVQSLEAPKHPIVTSLGHVRDPNCRNSDLSNSPHYVRLLLYLYPPHTGTFILAITYN